MALAGAMQRNNIIHLHTLLATSLKFQFRSIFVWLSHTRPWYSSVAPINVGIKQQQDTLMGLVFRCVNYLTNKIVTQLQSLLFVKAICNPEFPHNCQKKMPVLNTHKVVYESYLMHSDVLKHIHNRQIRFVSYFVVSVTVTSAVTVMSVSSVMTFT